MLHCRVRSLVGNARQEIEVATEDGNVACEVKLLEIRTRDRATKALGASQILQSRMHHGHLQLINNPAFWACHSVGHFLLAVVASTWAKLLHSLLTQSQFMCIT